MLDTTVAAAYAAQYAKAHNVEPRTGYDSNVLSEPHTYMLLDDLTPFIAKNDSLRDQMKDFGFELHVYGEGRMKIYIVPGHKEGGEHMPNSVPYCGYIEFKESKKASEANIRNAAYAARTLVMRYNECNELLDEIHDVFNGKNKPTSELVEYIKTCSRDWIAQAKKKYAKYLDRSDGSNVVDEQVLDGILVLDLLRKNCAVVAPFVEIEPAWFRHCIEKVLNLCSDVSNAYLTNDSCAIAVAIFIEDHFDPSTIKDSLQVPAIYEVMASL